MGKRHYRRNEEILPKWENFQVSREGFFEVKTASGRQSLLAAHADRRESDLARTLAGL